VVLPTGSGKTILFADVIRTMQPLRAMVIAHREELIWQAREKIHAVTGLDCGIEMGDNWTNNSLFGDTPVIISTIQTQNSSFGDRKRMSRFNPKEFGLLIIDECHHGTADTYKNLINYYKTNNPSVKILGVTATPDRADEEALGQVFDTVAYDYEILDAIHDGWLVPIDQRFVQIAGLDFSNMRTTAGDLNGADLAEVMESERNLQGVAGACMEILGNRRTIVFTASVNQAEVLSSILNRHKPGSSSWVCGKTPKDDRRIILDQFNEGRIQVVCNCGVLTEGFDSPSVEVIVMARPTKSRSLYAQMAGRSTRPLPGVVDPHPTPELRKSAIAFSAKPSCEIVDFVGNSGRHKLMSSADILGGNVSDNILEKAVEKAKAEGKRVNMAELIEVTEEEEKKRQKEEQERLSRMMLDQAQKQKIVAKVKWTASKVNPFDVFDMRPATSRGWDMGKSLSLRQKGMLQRAGFNPSKISFVEGKQLIGELFRRWDNKLCTMKQAALLKRFGYETKDMKKDEASKLIDKLASNNWKRV